MSRKRKKKVEVSKIIAIVIITVALIDLQLTYILAFLEKETAETLAVAIVTEIIAVVISYFIKSFNAKKEEEKTKLKRDMEGISESED